MVNLLLFFAFFPLSDVSAIAIPSVSVALTVALSCQL
jgi:hypothetical protein